MVGYGVQPFTKMISLCYSSLKSRMQKSNPQPIDYRSIALPVELIRHIYLFSIQSHSQYKKSHVSLHDSFQNYLFNFPNKNLILWAFPHKKSLATEVTRPFDKTCLLSAFYDSATGYENVPI